MQGDACPYSHEGTQEPCKQLVLHGVCRFGPNCHFSHDPLPAYAVEPLQEWFREQDQLKLDRSACPAHQAVQATPNQSSPAIPHSDGIEQEGDAAKGNTTALAALNTVCKPSSETNSSAVPQYASWKDGWMKLYGTRLQGLPKDGVHNIRTQAEPAAAFLPLSGPYTSWQDGWNRLFAKDKLKPSQTTEQA